MQRRRAVPLFLMALSCALSLCRAAEARTIRFSGYDWAVKSGDGLGPGPCNWSDTRANVWVDTTGALHLRLTQRGGKWYAAEIETVKRLGFGRYQLYVVGAIDKLDENVVLGLFNYPPPDVGQDGTNEIDIELARWGSAEFPNLNFTVWPALQGVPVSGKTYDFTLAGTYTTQRFLWRSSGILFQSLNGHRNDNRNEIARWSFAPGRPRRAVPQKPMPFHLNLWLFQGEEPSDGREVEVVIKSFSFTPS
jgi:hypothetical protein